jgi:Cft2 family RNA processing exonuclease
MPEPATIQFLGAAETVTGSKHLVTAGGHRVLLDCGLFQGLKERRLRNWRELPFDPRRLDAVVISHVHIDHTGFPPLLVRRGGGMRRFRGTRARFGHIEPGTRRIRRGRTGGAGGQTVDLVIAWG